MMQRGVNPLHCSGESIRCIVQGSQSLPLHIATESQISPLHDAAGSHVNDFAIDRLNSALSIAEYGVEVKLDIYYS
jgi:hypothetical protein